MEITLNVRKYNQEGDMAHEYRPLRNMLSAGEEQYDESGQPIPPKDLTDFRTKEISVDLNNPLNIECQPSYDGTVNLIINDDKNPPRLINTRFTTLEDNRYRIINRNQKEQTNIYEQTFIDQQTRLFRNLNLIPKIQFVSVDYFGQLKGGNYTFYVKFADNDFNKTDIVCESGQISIFNGTISSPSTITGTLQDERTDKSISLRINNIDTSFQKVYLYYSRETCDINGARITEYVAIKEPYDITNSSLSITVNGYEEVQQITESELNIKYLYVDRVKTQAQNQGMLFFGNVEMTTVEPRDLQALSLYIHTKLVQSSESIGYVNTNYKPQNTDDSEMTEYYNPQNLYYKLGYWPEEMYRLGIVYIMRDDSLTEVFNLRGIKFPDLRKETDSETIESIRNDSKYTDWFDYDWTDGEKYYTVSKWDGETPLEKKEIDFNTCNIRYVPKDDFILNGQYMDNIMGVFKLPMNLPIQDHTNKTTKPWGFQFSFPPHLLERLRNMGIKGFFFVRQKRIPTILCQGLSIGIDRAGHVPIIPMVTDGETEKYITEGFLDDSGTLSTNFKEKQSQNPSSSALLSVDPCVTPMLQSTFDGSEYCLQKYANCNIAKDQRRFIATNKNNFNTISSLIKKTNLIYVAEDTPFKYINEQCYSTRAGAAEEVKQISFLDSQDYNANNYNILRGIWCPIIGINSYTDNGGLYNIKIKNFSTVFEQEYFKIRGNDNSPFYSITDRYSIDETPDYITAFRGDCYTATVTMRLQRNFTDSDVPVNELIVDPNTWKNNYKGYNTTSEDEWLSINRADVNTCPIGSWITWKCLSNYNLGLRSKDYTNVEETALMGNPRSFYPITGLSVNNKVPESWKLNDGYSSTVSKKSFLPVQDIPYTRDIFDTRIMFSNVQQDDAFQNAYRIFQGLSFEDMDRQYGGLVKLISWGTSLLAIFEHGITIIPVNEKALIATTAGQSVHMYGEGVLQKQMTVISQDYGTIWSESIIRTPIGVYGVDTYAKKIWRFSQNKGLELISDSKIQRFLNDHILLKEKDKYPTIALRNVKSHYNNYKGDIMFTFYNDAENEEWNICYNERLDKWITRYSWVPLYSENVNNIYYSLDKKRSEILAYIYANNHAESGVVTKSSEDNLWNPIKEDHIVNVTVNSYKFYKYMKYEIQSIKTSYLDENDAEQEKVLYDINNPSTNDLFDVDTTQVVDNGSVLTLQNKKRDGVITLHKELLQDENRNPTYYYLEIIVKTTPCTETDTGTVTVGDSFNTMLGVLVDYSQFGVDSNERNAYEKLLRNGFYVHGRAGIFDEIDYFDEDRDNQILPTKWYNKQEPFEFEFVVNNATGMHKIFNNLVIISNKVKPKELEFEILGDVYHFNKAGIYWKQNNSKLTNPEWDSTYNKPVKFLPAATEERNEYPYTDSVREQWVKDLPRKTSENFKKAEIKWDPILNQYTIVTPQTCYDINEYGRMRGNIQYKEDSWYTTIEPILYKKADSEDSPYGVTGNTTIDAERGDWKSARIRDKWLKVRVKYSGEDLAIITAIKTMMTLSYS